MIIVDQRIAEIVVLVRELDGGLLKDNALFHAVVLGERARGDVADDDLERYDGNLLDHGLTVAELLDKVRRDVRFLFELLHQQVAHLVVDDALADDGALLQTVERGRVVLIGHDIAFGVVGQKYFLCLTFIELFTFFHNYLPDFSANV